MGRRSLLREWPLVVFTLALQGACGLVLAETIAGGLNLEARPILPQVFGAVVSPLIAVGVAISLFHLGRPGCAWRSVANTVHSRVSREIVLVAIFGASALPYSAWSFWGRHNELRFAIGLAATVFGIAAVLASADIYRAAARQVWNSGWVMMSFIGTTISVAGLALLAGWRAPEAGLVIAGFGCALLSLSVVWMYLRSARLVERAPAVQVMFVATIVLVVPSSCGLLTTLWLHRGSYAGFVVVSCGMGVAIILSRVLMFVTEELEPRF